MEASYLQLNPKYMSPEENRQAAGSLLEAADSDLVVLPELLTSGYFFRSQEHVEQVAEPIPRGPTTDWLRERASHLGTVLVAGLAERDGSSFYNSAVVVQPEGSVHTYRKVHLFYQENDHFEPGDLGFPVLEVSTRDDTSYHLGVMVCFDWYFPEAARTLALKGADVIAHPSNLVLPHCPDSMPVRARENHVFTVTANRFGDESNGEETLSFIGMSEVCGPNGDILSRAGEEEEVLATVEIDPRSARERAINSYNDVLGDRRPDTYRLNDHVE